MREAGFQPKEATRKANYIAYFKQSERIEDFLTAIGAPPGRHGDHERQAGEEPAGQREPAGEL